MAHDDNPRIFVLIEFPKGLLSRHVQLASQKDRRIVLNPER
jgi:hypothetical protein